MEEFFILLFYKDEKGSRKNKFSFKKPGKEFVGGRH